MEIYSRIPIRMNPNQVIYSRSERFELEVSGLFGLKNVSGSIRIGNAKFNRIDLQAICMERV